MLADLFASLASCQEAGDKRRESFGTTPGRGQLLDRVRARMRHGTPAEWPAHRASAQLHNALRDALACVSQRLCSAVAALLVCWQDCYLGWGVALLVILLVWSVVKFVFFSLCFFILPCAVCDQALRALVSQRALLTLRTMHASETSQYTGRASDEWNPNDALQRTVAQGKQQALEPPKINRNAQDVAIVDNHTAVTHASFLIT